MKKSTKKTKKTKFITKKSQLKKAVENKLLEYETTIPTLHLPSKLENEDVTIESENTHSEHKLKQMAEQALAFSEEAYEDEAKLKDPWSEKCEILKTEWAALGGTKDPITWLHESKGYQKKMSARIVEFEGLSTWLEKRKDFQNQALERFGKRAIDSLVESQDLYAKTAKLGLIKAMNMLTKSPDRIIDPTTGRWSTGLTPLDLKNCISAVAEAQKVTMLALGFDPNQSSINVVVNQLNQVKVNNAPAPTTFEDGKLVAVESAPDARYETMSHDEVWELVKIIREAKKRKESENGDNRDSKNELDSGTKLGT